MIALSVLIVILIWAWLGFVFWRRLIAPYIKPPILKIFLAALFAGTWLVAPVLDEILGAREFDQLCRDMPTIKFYGPATVGPGAFFDQQGRPKWKNGDEFSAIKRNTNVWGNEILEERDAQLTIRRWPMAITEWHSEYLDKLTHSIVLETYARYSKGGWLRSLVGLGDYQCPSKGWFPPDEAMIVFKK
jgi:hypothetical protein